MQKITLEYKGGLVTAIVEGQSGVPQSENDRIQKEWEKTENQKKLEELIRIYGPFKRVVDQETGVSYKIPTRDIITKGLTYEDLKQYPVWDE